ncbi:MAG: hypothetical protein ACREBS_08900 [Nitrososphaerales archaeon]
MQKGIQAEVDSWLNHWGNPVTAPSFSISKEKAAGAIHELELIFLAYLGEDNNEQTGIGTCRLSDLISILRIIAGDEDNLARET